MSFLTVFRKSGWVGALRKVFDDGIFDRFMGIGVTGNAVDVSVQSPKVAMALAGLTAKSCGRVIPSSAGAANEVNLSTLIGAVAGSVVRVQSDVDCHLGWGATDAAAVANAEPPSDDAATDAISFPIGVELLEVPAGCGTTAFLGVISNTTTTGTLSVSLVV